MKCPTCGNPCRRLDAGVVARGDEGQRLAMERTLAAMERHAMGATVVLLRDLRGILREHPRGTDEVTVIERVWECLTPGCGPLPVRIERETRIVEDLGPTRRRSVMGKRAARPDPRRNHHRRVATS